MKNKRKNHIERGLIGLLLAATLVVLMGMAAPQRVQADSSLQLSKKNVYLYVDQRVKLKVSADTEEALVWSSANKKVARVSQRGSLLAVGPGVTTITVRTQDGSQSASCKVKVGKYATQLQLSSAANVILEEGESSVIQVKLAPNRVFSKKVYFSSSDETVATVDANGKITARAAGSATIKITSKAKTVDGKKLSKKVRVYVSEAEKATTAIAATQVSGSQTTYTLNKTYVEEITATITLNDQSWTRSGTVRALIDVLENTWTTKTNSAGTIKVERTLDSDWWIVTEPSTGEVLLRIMAVSLENSQGQIIVDQCGGTVSFEIE